MGVPPTLGEAVSAPTSAIPDPSVIRDLEARIGTVVRGKPEAIRLAVVGLLAQGHLLIEDVPGVGKTMLARALSRCLGIAFQRIQFTSDLLPSDILGVSVFRQDLGEFEFVHGPIFANIVLADEINRASPKTQSALLEAMSEGQVTIDRTRYPLRKPFLVVATQNPLESTGTFPLPESQLDRFMLSFDLGYPPRDDERELLLSGGVETDLEALEPRLSGPELLAFQEAVEAVGVAPKLVDYALEIARATRESRAFLTGVSTRGLQALLRASQAMALCEGRQYVIPDDVQALAVPALAHRVVPRSGARRGSVDAVRAIVAGVPVPL